MGSISMTVNLVQLGFEAAGLSLDQWGEASVIACSTSSSWICNEFYPRAPVSIYATGTSFSIICGSFS